MQAFEHLLHLLDRFKVYHSSVGRLVYLGRPGMEAPKKLESKV